MSSHPNTKNKGYSAQLSVHRDTIQRIVHQHYDPHSRMIKWAAAFAADPALEKTLLVGPGDRVLRGTRLTQVTKRWIANGSLTLQPAAAGAEAVPAPAGNGAAPEPRTYAKGFFTKHAPLLQQIAAQYKDSAGKVWWRKAFAEHPDWAEQLGFKDSRQFLGRLGYWYNRHLAHNNGNGAPTATADSGLNFCPRCGCNMKAVAVALNLAERV